MKFTDRFIEVPIQIYSQSQKELTGKAEYIETYVKINPLEISEYGPNNEDESKTEGLNKTSVRMRGSDEKFVVYLSVYEFEDLLNNFK